MLRQKNGPTPLGPPNVQAITVGLRALQVNGWATEAQGGIWLNAISAVATVLDNATDATSDLSVSNVKKKTIKDYIVKNDAGC